MAARRSSSAPADAALLLLAVAAAACFCFSPAAAHGDSRGELYNICKSTPYPNLCTATAAGPVATHYPAKVDALTVLSMQVDTFSKRTAAARAHAAEICGTVSPAARTALHLCDSLYSDVEDNLGAARRAIGFKDAVTIRATMSMAAQDMQGCDQQFRTIREENPMKQFDQSLLNISENCRALSNMI